MLSEPTIAKKSEVEGYATFASLFLQFTAEAGNSVYRVVLSLRIPKKPPLKFRQEHQGESRKGSKVPKQDPVKFEMYCDLLFSGLS